MKKLLTILSFLLFINSALAFKVVPNTVGIGLQKNFDIVDFESGDELRCVLYHLGNPWSTNVTGWLRVDGELEKYFVTNKPERVFVPSGTFRYNSTCCLIPIEACFKFPWVLKERNFTGRIYAVYTTGKVFQGTGSATGSSVAYSLTVRLHPKKYIELNAGEKKCIEFYEIGKKCFEAPYFILSDYEEKIQIEGYEINLRYRNNLIIICLIAFISVLSLSLFFYWLRKRRMRLTNKQQQAQLQF